LFLLFLNKVPFTCQLKTIEKKAARSRVSTATLALTTKVQRTVLVKLKFASSPSKRDGRTGSRAPGLMFDYATMHTTLKQETLSQIASKSDCNENVLKLGTLETSGTLLKVQPYHT